MDILIMKIASIMYNIMGHKRLPEIIWQHLATFKVEWLNESQNSLLTEKKCWANNEKLYYFIISLIKSSCCGNEKTDIQSLVDDINWHSLMYHHSMTSILMSMLMSLWQKSHLHHTCIYIRDWYWSAFHSWPSEVNQCIFPASITLETTKYLTRKLNTSLSWTHRCCIQVHRSNKYWQA